MAKDRDPLRHLARAYNAIDDRNQLGRVVAPRVWRTESLVFNQFGLSERPAQVGPVLLGIQAAGDEALLIPCHVMVDDRIQSGKPSVLRREHRIAECRLNPA